ncbi:2-succinyl-6-hydroxy-2,4-cyclohexadiene-1-carboxylate synthase [Shewanella sp. A25]|nr:2-succinyl-6-hydroxy-2,4-cyclohexadiene-1-carboxylate synthase [Shewanella shenzhenensis]
MPSLARFGETSLPPLVLLHGFLGTKADWQPLLPKLSQTFHCICIDLPGHGDNQSELTSLELDGFAFCVNDIITRLDCLGVKQFHLFGYSLGGRIALHLAKAHPERLLSLVLESCHPGLLESEEKSQRSQNDALWADRLLSLTSKDFLNLWYQQGVFADLSKVERKQLITKRTADLDLHPKHCLKAIYISTSLARQSSLWDVPMALNCNCYYFTGSQDTKFQAIAALWQAQAPIIVERIENAGHNIHQTNPEALIERLTTLI